MSTDLSSGETASFHVSHVFAEWSTRLVNIVRSRLSRGMRKRVDAEDIVQSVFRTVWRRQQNGQMEIQDVTNAWRYMVRIAINKTCRAVRFNKASIRNVEKEIAAPLSAMPATSHHVDRSPLITEKLEAIASQLMGTHRQILELRFEGYTVSQVAEKVGVTRQTVYRCLHLVREQLEEEMADCL